MALPQDGVGYLYAMLSKAGLGLGSAIAPWEGSGRMDVMASTPCPPSCTSPCPACPCAGTRAGGCLERRRQGGVDPHPYMHPRPSPSTAPHTPNPQPILLPYHYTHLFHCPLPRPLALYPTRLMPSVMPRLIVMLTSHHYQSSLLIVMPRLIVVLTSSDAEGLKED